MIKKIVALGLVVMAAYILLPFGFGLWNENIGVRGQISFAQPTESVTTSPDSANFENQDDSVRDICKEEISNSDQTQSSSNSEESSAVSSPDNSANEKPDAPQASLPVGAEENAENAENTEQEQTQAE